MCDRNIARRPWIIFDGDNTLWHTEFLYDNAREELCQRLATRGHRVEDVHDFQQERDKELFKSLGYARTRFSRSFLETLLHFEPGATDEDKEFVSNLALNVFTSGAPAADDAGGVLDRLCHFYNLALITAGDVGIQASRLAAFPYLKFFRAAAIVPQKNALTLNGFLVSHKITANQALVIGDSIKSDILPAVKCGIRAVWITNKNWSIVENPEYPLPSEVQKVSSLLEFESLLEAKGNGL